MQNDRYRFSVAPAPARFIEGVFSIISGILSAAIMASMIAALGVIAIFF